jgi:deoxyribodipyrimidine photo-lyase
MGTFASDRPTTAIHWFRRDLRLHDNAALAAALERYAQVVPVFLFDPYLLKSANAAPARLVFLLRCLEALDENLRRSGSRLIVRIGRPAEVLSRLVQETGAAALSFNRDYTPYALARDAQVTTRVQAQGAAVASYQDEVLVEPGELTTKSGVPYTVFTPYSRAWRNALAAQPPVPTALPLERLRLTDARLMNLPTEPLALPAWASQAKEAAQWVHLAGGEEAGLARLHRFLDLANSLGIAGYARQRNLPALDATSRLSAFFKFGALSVRMAYTLAEEARRQTRNDMIYASISAWINELAWRDFYIQILAQFPYVRGGAFKRDYDRLEWENDQQLFQAWCEGQTGYPLVDAGMRQLRQEAWMHNRLRMTVAMFLTKDLLVDWRWGERYFMQHLVDGDLAANNGGWQWSASTGTDAQPYFRIFNPVNQSERFDPDGTYIRRYVPELRRVPTRFIHAPWEMPLEEQRRAGCHIGKEYPAPIVEHHARREQAIALYRRVGILADSPQNQ